MTNCFIFIIKELILCCPKSRIIFLNRWLLSLNTNRNKISASSSLLKMYNHVYMSGPAEGKGLGGGGGVQPSH